MGGKLVFRFFRAVAPVLLALFAIESVANIVCQSGLPFTTRPGVARRLLTFLLLRQKQSKQKKRRPCCLRPFAALRATCGAQQKRGHVQTRLAPQTSTCPDPLLLALLGAYRRAWAAGSDAALGSEIMTLWSFRALARVLRALFAIESVVLLSAGVGCLLRAGRGEPGGSSLSFAPLNKSSSPAGATPRQQTQKQSHRPSYENSDNPDPLPC